MTDLDDLEERLDGLEDQFGVGPTHVVIAGIEKRPAVEWPDGVDRDAVTVSRQETGIEPSEPIEVLKIPVPIHRPPEYRGGIVCMSDAEIARVYASMPDDVRERERELRIERGEPIPPILQR